MNLTGTNGTTDRTCADGGTKKFRLWQDYLRYTKTELESSKSKAKELKRYSGQKMVSLIKLLDQFQPLAAQY